jgi:hypothetical protein
MAKVKEETSLPRNKNLDAALAGLAKSEGTDNVLEMWKFILSKGGCGLTVAHAGRMAEAILRIKRDAFARTHPFLSARELKKQQPKERRADKTHARYIIAFLVTGAYDKFAKMCSITKSVGNVANACNEAMKVYNKTAKLPGDAGIIDLVKSAAKKRDTRETVITSASGYFERIIKTAAKLRKNHSGYGSYVTALVNSAKQGLKEAVADEKAAADDAAEKKAKAKLKAATKKKA